MQNRKSQTAAIQFSKKKQIISCVIGVVVALFLLGWGVNSLLASRRLADYEAKEAAAREKERDPNAPMEDRFAAREEARRERDRLSPDQREQLMQKEMQKWRDAEKKRYDAFFDEKDPKKQQGMLDKEIKDQEERRKQWEARAGMWGGGFGGGGGGGGGGWGNNGQGQGGDSSRRPRFSNEDREKMMKRILDSSTPQIRAQRTAYRQAMNDRRKELGLPPLPTWGGGGPGGGIPKGGAPKGGAPKTGGGV